MEFEFDKEIDALLRRSRRDGMLPSNLMSAHPDAEEIAAFAESAIPPAARPAYVAHFADCDRCRAILSNVILIAGAADDLIAAPAADPAVRTTPWYRRLFLFPQVAYSMGALVLIFSAFAAYLVFRGTAFNNAPDISRVTQNERRPSNSVTATANTVSNSAGVAQNTNAAAVTNTVGNTAPTSPGKGPRDDGSPVGDIEPAESDSDAAKRKEELSTTRLDDSKDKVAEPVTNIELAKPSPPRDRPTGGATAEKPVRDETANRASAAEEPLKTRSAPSVPAKKDVPSDIREIGGKTFRKAGATWTDSTYRSQPLTIVKRGSDGYKRLDAGIRSIADQLPGPVIIVWKERGYRID